MGPNMNYKNSTRRENPITIVSNENYTSVMDLVMYNNKVLYQLKFYHINIDYFNNKTNIIYDKQSNYEKYFFIF